jgi:hypothetical protein
VNPFRFHGGDFERKIAPALQTHRGRAGFPFFIFYPPRLRKSGKKHGVLLKKTPFKAIVM